MAEELLRLQASVLSAEADVLRYRSALEEADRHLATHVLYRQLVRTFGDETKEKIPDGYLPGFAELWTATCDALRNRQERQRLCEQQLAAAEARLDQARAMVPSDG